MFSCLFSIPQRQALKSLAQSYSDTGVMKNGAGIVSNHNYGNGIDSLMPELAILYPVVGRYSQKQIFIDSSHLTWNESFSCCNKARLFHLFVLRYKAAGHAFGTTDGCILRVVNHL